MEVDYSDKFEVKCLGEREEWVYDIEVEDNHNFFANDICVHNSNYLHFGPLVNKVFAGREVSKTEIVDYLDKVCETVFQEFIDASFDELVNYTNAYKNTLYMKREAICDRAIWTKKKRYILNVWDNEGVRYEKPKIKIKGLEAIKSSTPSICRDLIRNAIPIMMNGTEDEMIEYIKNVKIEFFKHSVEEISFPRSANNLEKYSDRYKIYGKKTPIQVRGALLHNHYLKKFNLGHKYAFIRNGDKIKYCALKLPNPIKEDVIAFNQTLPREFGLESYIDYTTQYNKSFLEPLRLILDAIGWETEKTVRLSNFFK
jgi:DNA polymerase elongation subunit (family B)